MKIGFVIFPQVTALDFVGPAQVFAQIASNQLYMISSNYNHVKTDAGFSIIPTATINDAPQMDLLCIPGGAGQKAIADNPEFMHFIKQQGGAAKYVTSVCSGSLILAKAGLLDGYKATSHWAVRDILADFGVTTVEQRTVIDGNRITGGGVTAGIDFALTIVAKLFGDAVAKLIQLGLEYDPKPPFSCGTPQQAGPELTQRLEKKFANQEFI